MQTNLVCVLKRKGEPGEGAGRKESGERKRGGGRVRGTRQRETSIKIHLTSSYTGVGGLERSLVFTGIVIITITKSELASLAHSFYACMKHHCMIWKDTNIFNNANSEKSREK